MQTDEYRRVLAGHKCRLPGYCEYTGRAGMFQSRGVQITEIVRWASLTTPNGGHIVAGRDCLWIREEIGLENAVKYSGIENEFGYPFYHSPLWPALSRAMSLEQAAAVNEMTCRDGKRFCHWDDSHPWRVWGEDVHSYLCTHSNSYDALVESTRRFDHKHATYATKMGLLPDEADFKDTGKPKAILAFAPFRSFPRGPGIIRELRRTYDTRIVFTVDKQGVFDAISDTPNASLLVISADGKRDDINMHYLSDGQKIGQQGDTPQNHITAADADFSRYLTKLASDARICLFCCSTGRGQEGGANLANKFSEWSEGRIVIAPRCRIANLQIDDTYPLQVRFLTRHGRDATYIATQAR